MYHIMCFVEIKPIYIYIFILYICNVQYYQMFVMESKVCTYRWNTRKYSNTWNFMIFIEDIPLCLMSYKTNCS